MENTVQPPITEPPPPPQEFPANKPIRWKLWLLLASIVVAVPASYLYFYVLKFPISQPIAHAPAPTPTPVEKTNTTESWKTYTNEAVGFSLQYPPSWTEKERSTQTKINQHIKICISECLAPDGKANISVCYYNNPQKLSLKDLDKELTVSSDVLGTGSEARFSSLSIEQKMDNGTTVYYQKEHSCEPVFCPRYIIPYNDKVFVITARQDGGWKFNSQNNQIVDQILSTFKFLDVKTGQQTISIQDDYSFNLFIPDGYYLKPGPGDYNIGAIYDKNDKMLIGFNGNSTPAGASTPTGSFTIDGVPFTVEYRPKGIIGCPMAMDPTSTGNQSRNVSVYFKLSTRCKDGKNQQDPIYEQIIKSITFNPKLKEVLLGKRLPPLIKGYTPKMPMICKNIDLNPQEMTFELAYCQGNYCVSKLADCNSADIMKIEDGKILSGQDGKPDCEWSEESNHCTIKN